MPKKISLVIPVMNEEDNIQPLLEHIKDSLNGWDYEVILVDDGSSDSTVAKIRAHADERTRAVIFNKNYGQTTAMAGGIAEAKGDYIITLDGDLQNDPSDIPSMIESWKKRMSM